MNNFKDEVSNKIKKYSNEEYLDGYIKSEFLTKEGNANIFLRLRDKYDLFDYRTVNNQEDLCSDVYDFIEDKSSMLDKALSFYDRQAGNYNPNGNMAMFDVSGAGFDAQA